MPTPVSAPPGRPRLLLPVLSLTDRLRTRSRLLVLVVVLVVPSLLAAGSFALAIGGQVRFAQFERAGVQVIAPAVQALAASAGGRTPDLVELRAAVRAHPELHAGRVMRAVDGAPAGPAQLAALATFVAAVGDSSKLILDPDLDSFYVMDALVVQLPRALTAIGTPHARATGPAAAASRAVQSGALTLAAQTLQTDVGTAVGQSDVPTLGDGLQPALDCSRQLSTLAVLVGSHLQQAPPEEAATRAAAAFAAAGAADALAAQLDVLLERRSSALVLRRDGTLAVTLAGLLVAVWIAAAVIWRTREDVRLTLMGVAAISDGDFQERALPHGSDEFGDIGRAVHGARQRLERLLFRDSLTGLPNRPMFLDRLQRALSDPASRSVMVLFLDLDRFKAVNDRLGHAAGDELLRAAAERIRRCTRPAGTAARFGGDEFAVVLPNHDEARARAVADRIIREMREPFTVAGGQPVHIGVTIGIARARDGVGPDDLLAEADVALYGAKRDGGGQARVYDPALRAEHLHRLQLEADLQSALPGGQLDVHYQPIVRLDTGATTGMEALLRWTRPGAGPVPPTAFIPLAEDNGLIIDIGRWVLEQTCRQLATWRTATPRLTANVNVSARQLGAPAFVSDVETALQRAGLPGECLTLEVTESMLLKDRVEALERLHLLRELGILVALDDFGTGYSSLSYLQHLPVDVLKIDRSFVSGTAAGQDALVRTIIELGRALRLSTTAEGIETTLQWDTLRRLGCGAGQGYLFARPLPVLAATDHLAAQATQRRLTGTR